MWQSPHGDTTVREKQDGVGGRERQTGPDAPPLKPHAISPAGQFPLDLFQLGAEMKVGGTPSPR